jgi:hypothetical protein
VYNNWIKCASENPNRVWIRRKPLLCESGEFFWVCSQCGEENQATDEKCLGFYWDEERGEWHECFDDSYRPPMPDYVALSAPNKRGEQ